MIFAQKIVEVDEYQCLRTVLQKLNHATKFNEYTGGTIKYTGLPKGTKVKVTLEIVEDAL